METSWRRVKKALAVNLCIHVPGNLDDDVGLPSGGNAVGRSSDAAVSVSSLASFGRASNSRALTMTMPTPTSSDLRFSKSGSRSSKLSRPPPRPTTKISIIFFAISSLLLSHASFVPDDIFPSSIIVSKPYQPEDAERTTAVVQPEKSTEGSISATVEPFHHVDLSLRHPIGRHIHRPIDPNFLRPFRHGCQGHRHGPRPPWLERDYTRHSGLAQP